MEKLKIEYLPVESLTPYEGNTRRHAPEDIEAIKTSIENDGFNDPIGIWGPDNLIVEGHGRQIAARELGIETVPVIRLDHMTEEQRKEYAIRHNRTAELSRWDFGKLEEELAALNIQGIDMDDLGFAFSQAASGSFEDFFTAVPIEKEQEKPADEPTHGTSESKPLKIQCPHCGEWFTP